MTRASLPEQTSGASVHVQFASAETPTMSPNAMQAPYGTGTPPPSPGEETREPSSAQQAQVTPSASTGTYPDPATPTHTYPDTVAPAVETLTMELSRVASLNLSSPTRTPYHTEQWTNLLIANNLIDKYHHIPTSLQHGFNAGIKYITRTYTPPNDESTSVHNNIFQQSVKLEFDKGRYEGPFSQHQVENLLGPFQTSPVSIIPKPQKPGKYRIIQNFSAPYTNKDGIRAINADIMSLDFPCT